MGAVRVVAQLHHGWAGTVAGVKLRLHVPEGRLIVQAPAAPGPRLGLSSGCAEQAAEHSCCKASGHARAGSRVIPLDAGDTKLPVVPSSTRALARAPYVSCRLSAAHDSPQS